MKSCNECPFSKSNILSKEKQLGGAAATVYIGQAQGPFVLPCHKHPKYDGKNTNYEEVIQCSGAAQFRANIGVSDRMPDQLLKLPKSNDVFESREKFLAYYLDTTEDFINLMFTEQDYKNMLIKEIQDANAKIINLKNIKQ
jgi:hypothetical protein